MAKYIMTVFSNALAGQEDEYNKWYDEEHIPDLLGVKQVVAAQRFKATPVQYKGKPYPPHDYLTIYEFESDDIETVYASLAEAAVNWSITPAIDRTNPAIYVFAAQSARETK